MCVMGPTRPIPVVTNEITNGFPAEGRGRTGLYEAFFGLQERPFDLVPNTRFLFLTEVQREALSTLTYGLTGPGGLLLLLGDAGTGKTTLVHSALATMTDGRVQCALVSNPTLTRDEFYQALSEAFKLGPQAAVSKTSFLAALREHAMNRSLAGEFTAIMIDEAQSLPDDLLEEIRLLSNLETSTTKLLNVVLAGQPELGTRLNQPSLRQLKQRISLRCELRAFDVRETAAYLAGRLRIAGGSPVEIFTREAVTLIFQASAGIPRVINVICENALISGFAAQTKPVTRAIVEEVVRDFDLTGHTRAADATREDAAPPAPAPGREPAAETPAPADESAQADPKARRGLFEVLGRKRPSFF